MVCAHTLLVAVEAGSKYMHTYFMLNWLESTERTTDHESMPSFFALKLLMSLFDVKKKLFAKKY